jgi:hypothetical protein
MNSEAAMNDPTPVRNPNLQLLVQDFDALADVVQKLMDDTRRGRHETTPSSVMQFTTEWQMEQSAEMAHSL